MKDKKKKTKIIKRIHIDADQCNGCRACEAICAAFHAEPKYSSVNPARSRIHVFHDPIRNLYLPVYAGEYTPAECAGRNTYTLNGQDYDECAFCRASCPSRDLFKEPDSGLPLKCDMCETEPPLEEPMCVQVCIDDALTYEEVEVEVEEEEEEVKVDELELGLEALIDKYGMDEIAKVMARMAAEKEA